MGLLVSVLVVALVAGVSGALAIPLGIFIGLHPVAVYATTVTSALVVTWVLLLGGHRFRTAIADRFGHGEHAENRTKGFVERYGSVGLGLVGPLFPGVIASTISGVAIGVESKHLGRWLTIGIIAWFGLFTVVWWAVAHGIKG